jgi:mannose/fructose/N-acetylgalactosamine-specific phosphotransferase system component IID
MNPLPARELLSIETSVAGLLANVGDTKLWYLLPLVVSISLVYASTRHELMGPILVHAVRFAVWIVVFMAVVFGVIYGISLWL